MEDKSMEGILYQVRKNNGAKIARALSKMEVSPQIVDILKYAEDLEITSEIKNFLYFLMGKHHLIQKNPYEGQDLKEVEQKIHQIFDEQGYFIYFVNPPDHAYTLQELQGRQDAPIVYFDVSERWCTFTTPRFEKNFIIHAIRKDLIQDLKAVEEALANGDFKKLKEEFAKAKDALPKTDPPLREDEYSHSVITIQFDKKTGTIIIVGRRNHAIENGRDPDRTFDANPDKIAPGLTDCFFYILGLHEMNPSAKNILPQGYTLSNHNQIVKYHTEDFDGVLYGEQCYVKDGNVHPFDEHMLGVENFIINKKNREIKGVRESLYPDLISILEAELIIDEGKEYDPYNPPKRRDISFGFDKQTGEKIMSVRHQKKWVRMISFKDGKITKLHLPTTKELPPSIVKNLPELEEFSAPLLEKVERANFWNLPKLKRLSIPNVRKIDQHCFFKVGSEEEDLPEFELEHLETIGSGTFNYVNAHVKAPNLTYAPENTFVDVKGRVQVKGHIQKENLQFILNKLKEKAPHEHILLFDDANLGNLRSLIFREFVKKDEHENILFDENNQVCMYPVEVKQDPETQYKSFYIRDEKGEEKHIFTFNSSGRLVHLSLPTTQIIPKGATANGCERLESLEALNLTEIEEGNFSGLRFFQKAHLPQLEKIGDDCFCKIKGGFTLPCLKEVGKNSFLNVQKDICTPMLDRDLKDEKTLPVSSAYHILKAKGKD